MCRVHELAVTQSMVQLVIRHAEKAGAARVSRINLVVGELSGYVDECVQQYFDLLSKGTLLEKAELLVRRVPATGKCKNCGNKFEVVAARWTCTSCGGQSIELLRGDELLVESIEVD
jgi:hydrogenase nickel incorporation protein HypA/HybF